MNFELKKQSNWILGLSYGALLIGTMAAAEGQFLILNDEFLISGSEFNLKFKIKNSKLLSEAEIPTDEATWRACYDHRDCQEAKINMAYQAGDLARVAIGAYPIFDLEASKIFRSTNGKSYFCRLDLTRPPDRENTRCVFHGRPRYVRR